MALSCSRCARCGALSRVWSKHLRFAMIKGQWRPACLDEQACRERQKNPPEQDVFLCGWTPTGGASEEGDPAPKPKRPKRELSPEHRQKLREHMQRVNAKKRAAAGK